MIAKNWNDSRKRKKAKAVRRAAITNNVYHGPINHGPVNHGPVNNGPVRDSTLNLNYMPGNHPSGIDSCKEVNSNYPFFVIRLAEVHSQGDA